MPAGSEVERSRAGRVIPNHITQPLHAVDGDLDVVVELLGEGNFPSSADENLAAVNVSVVVGPPQPPAVVGVDVGAIGLAQPELPAHVKSIHAVGGEIRAFIEAVVGHPGFIEPRQIAVAGDGIAAEIGGAALHVEPAVDSCVGGADRFGDSRARIDVQRRILDGQRAKGDVADETRALAAGENDATARATADVAQRDGRIARIVVEGHHIEDRQITELQRIRIIHGQIDDARRVHGQVVQDDIAGIDAVSSAIGGGDVDIVRRRHRIVKANRRGHLAGENQAGVVVEGDDRAAQRIDRRAGSGHQRPLVDIHIGSDGELRCSGSIIEDQLGVAALVDAGDCSWRGNPPEGDVHDGLNAHNALGRERAERGRAGAIHSQSHVVVDRQWTKNGRCSLNINGRILCHMHWSRGYGGSDSFARCQRIDARAAEIGNIAQPWRVARIAGVDHPAVGLLGRIDRDQRPAWLAELHAQARAAAGVLQSKGNFVSLASAQEDADRLEAVAAALPVIHQIGMPRRDRISAVVIGIKDTVLILIEPDRDVVVAMNALEVVQPRVQRDELAGPESGELIGQCRAKLRVEHPIIAPDVHVIIGIGGGQCHVV